MRKAVIKRESKETSVFVEINLDGSGKGEISTGVPFFDHMLEQFRRHSFIDLTIKTKGDHHIDDHHSVEDTGIVLGKAIKEALGERKGIKRYASSSLPMDETLVNCAIDMGTRPFLVYDVPVDKERINTFETELCVEFWRALVHGAGFCVHFHKITGINSHHIIEASFKAFALAFDAAKQIDERMKDSIRTTKGII
ncbi:MAG: imidazoleglycerol-phosphate dehydratase HisB [Candidatus Caenarcaniphilales bacterium]|nr:imidazoleglycerol-phosphate dehydratase HisB [Candidatus Caenarcaniphilales bacterium]